MHVCSENPSIRFGAQLFVHFSAQKIIYMVSVIHRVLDMTKQHREYKILRRIFLGAHIKATPQKNALYHTVQMVLVDPCDKLIICFLWLLKRGKHNYILSLHQ